MQQTELIFDYSPIFILFCLVLGAAYAYVLYRKSGPWDVSINRVLFVLRSLSVSLIAFLILGPLLKQFRNTIEQPSYVILFDNSLSVTEVMDSTEILNLKEKLKSLQSSLSIRDKEVSIYDFDIRNDETSLEVIQMETKSTDLSSLLGKIRDERAGTNLAGVILASDGIYNRGSSPLYSNYNFPIYSIGIGDTIPKADLNLQNVYYNKIAYQGNQFPVIAEIFNNGFKNTQTKISLIHNNEVLQQHVLEIENSSPLIQVNFLIEAKQKGPQHYIIDLEGIRGEFTLTNNRKHVYIDIIEGKEKILIVANSPHPDIKAIRNVVEKNENYELKLIIPGIVDELKDAPESKFDLVIFHQLPSSRNSFNMETLMAQNSSFLYILGAKSSIEQFNEVNQTVKIQAKLQQKDEVTPVFNTGFSKFTFDDELQSIVHTFPPVPTPFGNYNLLAGAEVLLYQQFGSVMTEKPLIAVSDINDQKSGVIIGDNFWRWRLQEFALTGEHKSFDELFSKLIQYLSSKEDKRKFKVYTVNKEFTDNEPIIFDTEIYNDIYEKIYNHKIDLAVIAEDGNVSNYSYVNSESNSRFRVSDLNQGTYQFVASTELDGKKEEVRGNFIVSALQIESLDLTANHALLRDLSERSGGTYYSPEQMDQLENDLSSEEVPGIIHSTESFLPVLNLPWVLALILILISIEWFVRKFQGSY